MDTKKFLIIAGILFTLHNVEEAIGFLNFKYPVLPSFNFSPPAPLVMVTAICIVTIVAWCLIFYANTFSSENFRRNLLLILFTVFIFNALIPHIGASILLKRYFPALFTSIFLYIPFSVWILPRIYRSFQHKKMFFQTAILGLMAAGGITVLIQFISKLIINKV